MALSHPVLFINDNFIPQDSWKILYKLKTENKHWDKSNFIKFVGLTLVSAV